MPNSSNSSPSPMEILKTLQDRRKVALLLVDTDFPALLETLVAEAQQPVPPTLSNWLVLRAWADGSLSTALKCQNLFNLGKIDQSIKEYQDAIQKENDIRPVGQKNPFDSPFARAR